MANCAMKQEGPRLVCYDVESDDDEVACILMIIGLVPGFSVCAFITAG
jgi:hypothetical protein